MAVIKRDGLTKEIWFFSAASTTLNSGSFVSVNGLGQVINSTSASTTILGYYQGPQILGSVTTQTYVPITVPIEKAVELTIDVEAGTVATSQVGLYMALNDSTGMNAASTSNVNGTYPILVTGVLSTTGGASSLGQITGVINPTLL